MLQLACTLICCSLLQFILVLRRATLFDIIYDSACRELMRGMGFLENYCEAIERSDGMLKRGEECLNEDLKLKTFMFASRRPIGIFNFAPILQKKNTSSEKFYSLPGNRCGNIRPCRLNSQGYSG